MKACMQNWHLRGCLMLSRASIRNIPMLLGSILPSLFLNKRLQFARLLIISLFISMNCHIQYNINLGGNINKQKQLLIHVPWVLWISQQAFAYLVPLQPNKHNILSLHHLKFIRQREREDRGSIHFFR